MMIVVVIMVVALIAVLVLVVQTLYVKLTYNPLNYNLAMKFKSVQLSDLHGRTRFINGSISEIVNKIQPDYVLITGDRTSKKKQLARVDSFRIKGLLF